MLYVVVLVGVDVFVVGFIIVMMLCGVMVLIVLGVIVMGELFDVMCGEEM